MLISHIAEENGKNEPYVEEIDMSESDDITSAQRDLLILYENDVKQRSVSMGTIFRMPNQHVENVVYKDGEESEDSDVSDIYRGEDLYDVVMINKERIDLLNSAPSVEKSLRQKFGDIAIQSGFQSNYHQHNLLKNPYVKSQYRSLDNISNYNAFDGALLSTCLLDFICYNQLDDNSNFYMDSIIQYAKRTIDQLKRISNGDYLTEKAKEQWKTIDNECKSKNDDPNAKAVMAKCHTFYVESDKTRQFENTLRGLVHSELDMRSLSKILEKQLFVRIPRLIRNSYKFFGKFCDNDVIIECKKVKQRGLEDKSKSRVDILIKLASSKLGEEDKSTSLINFKQPLLCLENEPLTPEKCKRDESTTNIIKMQNNLTITELNECDIVGSGDNLKSGVSCAIRPFKTESSDTANSSSLYISDNSLLTDTASNGEEQSFTNDVATIATTASCTVTPDDLFCSIQQFSTQSVLIEENEDMPLIKKKSPTKVRVKSPYENKTFAIEERKRRKLLEIRERRERRKKALSENCKVTKHRYGKGAIMAQASNSVTKLSITNKSFYTSIYGDNADLVNKHDKRHSIISNICIDRPVKQEPVLNKESKKFVNRSYYLDDPETEVMNIRNKDSSGTNDKDFSTPSSSIMMNGINMELNAFAKLDKRSSSCFMQDSSFESKKYDLDSAKPKYDPLSDLTLDASTRKSLNNTYTKEQISLDCKKSIDKIYELMKRLNSVDSESTCSKREFSQSNDNKYQNATQSSIIRATDSGTSVKHRLKSSNLSIYSFEDQINIEAPLTQSITTDRSEPEPNVISKVIISNKSQTTSNYKEIKPPKKVTIKPPANISKNPLKAISHLINEFDHIQRSRQKPATDVNTKDHKKTSKTVVENKNVARQTFIKRSSNIDSAMKDVKPELRKTYHGTDRNRQPKSPVKGGKVANHMTNLDRNIDRETKISDMIEDAMREARGEAVKGPKLNPRLESLAQPKRFLVNGQEELKLKNRKHLYDKTPHVSMRNSLIPERMVVSPVTYSKSRQKRNEMEYINPAKTPNYSPLTDKQMRARRLQHTSNNVPTNNAPVQNFSRLPKKIMSNDVYIKRKPLILTQTAGSSNLLQKTQTSHVIPPENLQTKDSASPNPIKKMIDIESGLSNNSLQEKNLEQVQMTTKYTKESKNNGEIKTGLIAINHNEIVPTSSDYAFDVLEDKNVLTAVENISRKNDKSKKEQIEETSSNLSSITNIEKDDITTEGIKNLEKAIYQQLSQGVFLNRPKVKNLTLSPKKSSHQVFLLQCGDANSLLIKSCLSQNLHLSNTQCLAKPSFELKFPLLPKPNIDRIFSRTSTNITTVGCVFPNSRSIGYNPNSHNTPDQKSNIFVSDKEFSKKSNDEKGVQALLLDKNTYGEDFDSNFIKKTIKDKIDKGTEWDKSLVSNVNGNSEALNDIDNENIDNTTSLDVLTELMEEIEKITKYQSVPAKNEKMEYNPLCYASNNCVCHDPTSCLVNDNIFSAPLVSGGGKLNTDAKYVDKEVAVYITKESVHVCTDAPSQLWFPKGRCERTSSNMTISQQRSSRSLVSLYDYRALYSNKFNDISDSSVTYSKTKNNDNSAGDYKKLARISAIRLDHENWGQKDLIKSDTDQNDCNAILRMKRDILVTVYSILVFTVFAALSFPNILYNI